jgi:putative addiction module killer protein
MIDYDHLVTAKSRITANPAGMFKVETTEEFDSWLEALNMRTRVRIASRLAKLARGLWGDHKAVGDGVVELREHFGPGFRIYVVQRGATLVIALAGGNKSTQRRDIHHAAALARQAKE